MSHQVTNGFMAGVPGFQIDVLPEQVILQVLVLGILNARQLGSYTIDRAPIFSYDENFRENPLRTPYTRRVQIFS